MLSELTIPPGRRLIYSPSYSPSYGPSEASQPSKAESLEDATHASQNIPVRPWTRRLEGVAYAIPPDLDHGGLAPEGLAPDWEDGP